MTKKRNKPAKPTKQRITIDLTISDYNKLVGSKLYEYNGTLTATLRAMIRKLK